MIKFINHDRKFYFSGKKALKAFIQRLFRKEGKLAGEIHYIFCSDNYLLEMNKQFLGHDYYTDILTFDMDGEHQINGEIYISVDRVRENASEYGDTVTNEMLRVIFHGALHLCGHLDKTKSEITLMREKESGYLRLFEKENTR